MVARIFGLLLVSVLVLQSWQDAVQGPDCPAGWEQDQDNLGFRYCFKFSAAPLAFDDVQCDCRRYGPLVDIAYYHNMEQMHRIAALLPAGHHAWGSWTRVRRCLYNENNKWKDYSDRELLLELGVAEGTCTDDLPITECLQALPKNEWPPKARPCAPEALYGICSAYPSMIKDQLVDPEGC
ncbi:unnamed protein product, partial [Mesorhabditis spiculigera]